MTDLNHSLNTLRRPRILVRAARHGMRDYNRQRDLRRITRVAVPKSSEAALSRLVDMEARLEDRRRQRDAHYSMSRHVDVLIALMGEAAQL